MFESLSAETVVHLTNLSTEALAIAGVLLFLLALGFAKGKSELLAVLCAVYPATLIAYVFPYASYLTVGGTGQAGDATRMLIIFGVVLVVCVFGLRRFVSVPVGQGALVRTVELVLLSALITGTLLAVAVTLLEADTLYPSSALTARLFDGSLALFWWLVGGIISTYILVRT